MKYFAANKRTICFLFGNYNYLLTFFIELAKKYGEFKKMILPYLSNNVNKRILLENIKPVKNYQNKKITKIIILQSDGVRGGRV